jgi:hypothetical protein
MVHLVRDGIGLAIPVTLLKSTKVKYDFESVPNPTTQQLAVRNKWLSLK